LPVNLIGQEGTDPTHDNVVNDYRRLALELDRHAA
jgi:hypothetical protein